MYINVNIDTNSDFGTYLFGQHEEGTFTQYGSVQLWQETIWFCFMQERIMARMWVSHPWFDVHVPD